MFFLNLSFYVLMLVINLTLVCARRRQVYIYPPTTQSYLTTKTGVSLGYQQSSCSTLFVNLVIYICSCRTDKSTVLSINIRLLFWLVCANVYYIICERYNIIVAKKMSTQKKYHAIYLWLVFYFGITSQNWFTFYFPE